MTDPANSAVACIMVILVQRSLTKRLLMPALYNLARSKLLAKRI